MFEYANKASSAATIFFPSFSSASMGGCLSKKGWEKKSGSTVAAAPSLDPNVPIGSRPSSDSGHDKKIILQEEEQHREEFEKKKDGSLSETPDANEDEIMEHSSSSYKGLKSFDAFSNRSGSGVPVRTSSCTKEELDAILIQCGRLSRSSSGKGGSTGENQNLRSNRYSGSKRSYDFDDDCKQFSKAGEDKPHTAARRPRRRTPSRERDSVGPSQLNRSSSYGEEGGRSSGRRRPSRSPVRRSETPAENNKRPTKIVSIPATAAVKRGISTTTPTASSSYLKRSGEIIVGGARSNASPRSLSPATTASRSAAANENSAPQASLSRNSSRKTEYSPCRRNPMQEIDDSALNIKLQQPATDQCHRSTTNKMLPAKIKKAEEGLDMAIPHLQVSDKKSTERSSQMQKQQRKNSPLRRKGIREQLISSRAAAQELQPEIKQVTADANRVQIEKNHDVSPETINFQKPTRSRSSRRSRDLDLVVNSSYASWLIEDNCQDETSGFTLPACVSKACSILEAVADLNSSANSNRSSALSYNGGKILTEADGANNHLHNAISRLEEGKLLGKKSRPYLESEVDVTGDDLTVPSLHKYVTARDFRSGAIDQQESAGSNSFLFLDDEDDTRTFTSFDSTDRWTSSLSKAIVHLELQASSK